MKKIINRVLTAAIFICGATVLTSGLTKNVRHLVSLTSLTHDDRNASQHRWEAYSATSICLTNASCLFTCM